MKYERLTCELSWEEVAYLEGLKKRDVAKPIVEHEFEWDGRKHKVYKCPVCDETLGSRDAFCGICGQRVDRENIAL